MPNCEERADTKDRDSMIARLLKTRTVLITGPIDQELAESIVGQLLVLDSESHDPIRVIITSQGGHVDSGFAIYDMLQFISSKVICIGAGWVASIAVPILFAADKQHRLALPNTRFLIHQPSGGIGGPASDIRIEAQEILKIRERLNKLLAEETGQSLERIRQDSDRNFWMTAEEALKYGLISRIVQSMDEIR